MVKQRCKCSPRGEKKSHRAYVWTYRTTAFADLKAVVYDFSPSRAGEQARNHLVSGMASWPAATLLTTGAGHHLNWRHGPRPAQVLRLARGEQKPTGRTGAARYRWAVQSRTPSARHKR